MAIIQTTIQGLRTMASGNTTDVYYVTDSGQEGNWYYAGTSTSILDNTGTVLTSPLITSASNTSSRLVFKRVYNGTVNVRWFGAVPNLASISQAEYNTIAFNEASKVLWGVGGELLIPPGVYHVGRQYPFFPTGLGAFTDGSSRCFWGNTIIDIRDCKSSSVRIIGKGATLKFIGGFYYGAWSNDPLVNPPNGIPVIVAGPTTDAAKLAEIGDMIRVYGNRRVAIEGLTLDGNIQNQIIGGEWGSAGYQCNHSGIWATNNEQLILSNLKVVNFGLNGVSLNEDGFPYDPSYSTQWPNWLRSRAEIHNCIINNNGSIGINVSGIQGMLVLNTKVNNTGKTGHSGWKVASSAGAGFHLNNATNMSVGNTVLINSEFISNLRFGIAVYAGAAGITGLKADKCFFHAKDEGAKTLMAEIPEMSFTDCKFIGFTYSYVASTSLKNSMSNKERMTRYTRCWFEQAMNDTSSADDYFDNTILNATGAILADCVILYSVSSSDTNVYPPEYLVRAYYGVIRNSAINIINGGVALANGAKLAHFYEMLLEGVDVVVGSTDTSKGWIIEDHCITAAGVTPASQNVTINQVVKRLGTRTYWQMKQFIPQAL